MILFELRLGPAQIAALRTIAAGMYSANPPPDMSTLDVDHNPHWLVGVRRLSAEGLIVWYPTGNFQPHYRRLEAGGPHWEITEKGKLVLQLIDMEIADHQAAVSEMLEAGKRARIVAPKRKRRKA